jgi:molybdopterin synthase catalytic subunit
MSPMKPLAQLDVQPWVQTGLVDGPVQAVAMPWPDGCGGEAVFLGRTRRETHPTLGPLHRLSYEVYPEMVLKLMDAMARDAAGKFGCRAVRLVHARGEVPIGAASVVIQVATPHRGEAFAACRYLIDRLKHELPIWKRELWERGETYVHGCCAHHGGDDSTKGPA